MPPGASPATPGQTAPAWGRLPFLVAGFLALFGGMAGGLARLGWSLPDPAPTLAGSHGPLMVSGFFGTLIALERAVALGRPAGYFAPALAGAGALALLLDAPEPLTPLLFVAAAIAFAAVSGILFARQKALFTAVTGLGACAWAGANLVWAASGPSQAVPLWILFFVLTIAGERLELTRLLPPRRGSRTLFLAAAGVLAIGSLLGQYRILGLGLLALAAWLGLYDIARRTILQHGLPRFTAACLLSGYLWLAAAGAAGVMQPVAAGDLVYDALLHAVFLGFVFAMVFGHAPIIFPAILRLAIPYHPLFYAPLLVLHLALLARWLGDVVDLPSWRLAGGLGNAAAILLFVVVMAWRGATARR